MVPILAPVVGIAVQFGRAVRRGLAEPEFRGLLYMVAVVVTSGTVFYRLVERWGWVDSLYFTMVTLTTVGYGDAAPITMPGKLMACVIMLTGFAIIAVPTGVVTAELGREIARNRRHLRCRECGWDDHDHRARFCQQCGIRLPG